MTPFLSVAALVPAIEMFAAALEANDTRAASTARTNIASAGITFNVHSARTVPDQHEWLCDLVDRTNGPLATFDTAGTLGYVCEPFSHQPFLPFELLKAAEAAGRALVADAIAWEQDELCSQLSAREF